MELRPWGWEASRQGSAPGNDLEDEHQAQSTPALQNWKTEPCGGMRAREGAEASASRARFTLSINNRYSGKGIGTHHSQNPQLQRLAQGHRAVQRQLKSDFRQESSSSTWR